MDYSVVGVTPVQVALVLRNAVQLLRDGGWYQGRFTDPDSEAMDATQAICRVLDVDLVASAESETRIPVGSAALIGATLAAVRLETRTEFLAVWNDRSQRTVAEVIDLFERVAETCERAESIRD